MLADSQIKQLALEYEMIFPFTETQQGTGKVSFGLSSYGYDVSAADEFKIFTNVNAVVIDPKAFSDLSFVEGVLHYDETGTFIIAPPNSFVLARTKEYLRIPRHIAGLMTVKSTYARCGLVSPPTVLEPEWEGHITIEISNTTPLPARIYANEGIAQVLFLCADELCTVSYADRKGKYQGQRGITLPKVMK